MSERDAQLVTIEQRGPVSVARFTEAALLDPMLIERADQELMDLVRASSQPRIVIALDKVEQLSSLMFSVLIRVRGEVGGRDGQVCLAAIPQALQNLFDLVKVGDLFDTYTTIEEAVAALS